MALPNYAGISVADFRQRISAGGSGQAANIEAAIIAATLATETRIDRQLRTRGSMTEYHTIGWRDRLSELYVSQWPIITAVINEDTTTPRTYGAGSLLVAGTGYELVYPDRIRRLDGGGSGTYWATGNRVVKNVMTAGYRGLDGLPSSNSEDLPDDLKQVIFFVSASIFTENDRKRWGVSSATDAAGNYQRFTGYFTPALDEMLAPYRRREFHRTWERAA